LRVPGNTGIGHKAATAWGERMNDVISIKPHHFIDILTEYGAGRETWQPHPYRHAVHTVAQKILANHDAVLEMNSGIDDICKPCVHNINGKCDDMIDTSYRPQAPPAKHDWNLLIDNRWYARLGLTDGDRLTAREFVIRLRDAISNGIDDIYREIPADMNARRLANLKAGIAKFLAD